MPRPLFDSPYIFGIHEPGGEPHMLAAGKPGWILFSEVLGHDPADGFDDPGKRRAVHRGAAAHAVEQLSAAAQFGRLLLLETSPQGRLRQATVRRNLRA